MVFTIVNVNAMTPSRVDRIDPLGQVDAHYLKTYLLPFLAGSEEYPLGSWTDPRGLELSR